MPNIIVKQKEIENKRKYYVIPQDSFIVANRMATHDDICEEYDIIQKIKENKDGFFDFSKHIIDIGAEDGSYTTLIDWAGGYMFEPNKSMCCLCYANMYLHDKIENFYVYNCALDSCENQIEFDGFSIKDGGFYRKIGIQNHYKNDTIIKTQTLDYYNLNNIGFIKIDVEGMEYNVLLGGVGTIVRNNFPPILFECWNVGECGMTEEKRNQLFCFVKGLGYTILENFGNSVTHLAVRK